MAVQWPYSEASDVLTELEASEINLRIEVQWYQILEKKNSACWLCVRVDFRVFS